MSKDIMPRNDKGEEHGYWEYYWVTDTIGFKCYYINGELNGYEEYHNNILKPFNIILTFHIA